MLSTGLMCAPTKPQNAFGHYIPQTYSPCMRGRQDVTTPEALALALRDARRHAGLNQTGAAHRAGVARAAVSAAERGCGNLASRALLGLARAYGCALRLAPAEQHPVIARILGETADDTGHGDD